MFKVASVTPMKSEKGLEYKSLRLQKYVVNPLVAQLGSAELVLSMGEELLIATAEKADMACFPAGEYEGNQLPESLHYNAKIGTTILGKIVQFNTTPYKSLSGNTVTTKTVFVEEGQNAINVGLRQLSYVGASIIDEDGVVHVQRTAKINENPNPNGKITAPSADDLMDLEAEKATLGTI